MSSEKLFEELYEAKALVNVYSSYSFASPRSELERRSIQKEMKAVRDSISRKLSDMRRLVKRMESEVKPG